MSPSLSEGLFLPYSFTKFLITNYIIVKKLNFYQKNTKNIPLIKNTLPFIHF